MAIALKHDALVVLVGASASGKSYWAHGHFRDTQVVSSDRCRALVSDDEENQRVSREAFAVFYTLVRQRMSLGRLTVADSTGLQEFSRRRLVAIARDHGRPVYATVFVVPPEVLLHQNALRTRRVPPEVLLRHAEHLQALLRAGTLHDEGYEAVYRVDFPFGPGSEPEVVRGGASPRTGGGSPADGYGSDR